MTHNAHLRGYSDAEIQTIAAWLREGLSAAGIAGRLSVARGTEVTRNAIIGIVQRNATLKQIGFQQKPSRPAADKGSRGQAPRVPKVAARVPNPALRVARSAQPAPAPPAPIVVLPPNPAARSTFLAAATEGRCLFFADDPMAPAGSDMPVCGCERQTRSRKPYCEYHLRAEAA